MPTDQLRNSDEPSLKSSTNKRLVSEQIYKLLTHYWIVGEDDALRKLQVADWIADFEEFPSSIVAEVCMQWRRTEEKRPSIAALRARCAEYLAVSRRQAAPMHDHSEHNRRPPDHVIRMDWRIRHVREWTKSELETANLEMLVLAHKYGFYTGNDRQDRIDYAKASLRGEVPGYDCVTGGESQFKTNLKHSRGDGGSAFPIP